MAITAAITLTSAAGDLVTDALSLSTSANLTKAGTSTAIANTSGLARRTTSYASSDVIDTVVLYRGDDYTNDGANKIYLKNTSSTAAEYFTVYMTGDRATDVHTNADPGLTELGRLYAGDWALLPFNGDQDIKVTPSVSTALTVEYLVIFE